LKYLNLSGNKKLDLKQNNGGKRVMYEDGRVLSDFSLLSQLRVLGLMDVMTTFLPNILEETDERRVRTSQTQVNGMSYGIADTIGRDGYLTTLDLVHNNLLQRHLRYCGAYVVKTEGDAFMCSFPTTLAAMWWRLIVQMQLLREFWPLEILECDEGKEVHDDNGNLLSRGLSVRMGVHCGTPMCESDPSTGRMDYFGPIVIRAARISGNAAGGQIMCSAAVVREINAKIFGTGPDTEYSEFQPTQAIGVIRQMQIAVIPAGEIKSKGLEIPEVVSLVYPAALLGHQDLDASGSSLARVQLSIGQVRELAVLCLRFEALTSSRVFYYPRLERKDCVADLLLETLSDEDVVEPSIMYGDPSVLFPPMTDKTSDLEIMMQLDSLSLRLENAAKALTLRSPADRSSAILTALEDKEGIDEQTLHVLASLLSSR
jgi:adenylate cyclase